VAYGGCILLGSICDWVALKQCRTDAILSYMCGQSNLSPFVPVLPSPPLVICRYGKVLLEAAGKPGRAWESKTDISIRKVSLGTQNGAYDYYNSGDLPSEQDALEAQLLKTSPSGETPFPFASVLLDSWWYPKVVRHLPPHTHRRCTLLLVAM